MSSESEAREERKELAEKMAKAERDMKDIDYAFMKGVGVGHLHTELSKAYNEAVKEYKEARDKYWELEKYVI